MDYSKTDIDKYHVIMNRTTIKILDTLKYAVGDMCSKQDGMISKEQFDMVIDEVKGQINVVIDEFKLKANDLTPPQKN